MGSDKFTVWVHIERINEDADIYEDVDEPHSIGEFDTQEEAESARRIIEAHQKLRFAALGLIAKWRSGNMFGNSDLETIAKVLDDE